MIQLGAKVNLIICQKSKVDDWVEHFKEHYWESENLNICDLTNWKAKEFPNMLNKAVSQCGLAWDKSVLIINYELAFRRSELLKLKDFTLMLDESSMIQNEKAKRTKFILKLNAKNVILLSGTPTSGRYERLWSQLHLLGWNIPRQTFYRQYVIFHYEKYNGFMRVQIDGYKNVERLKRKMREYGCNFLKTEEVLTLPEQIHQTIKVKSNKEYKKFRKDRIITIGNEKDNYVQDVFELVGDTPLKRLLYSRQLCGQYNREKLAAFKDLVESTNDRLIVFYNFNAELDALLQIANECQRQQSIVNGAYRNLSVYEGVEDSITFIQYQAGAMGLNLQKANKIIYFSPPLSSELFEQSKKRTHRLGQKKTCFYYYLTCSGSVEEDIYKTLEMRKDYTDKLFEQNEQ